MTTPTEFVLWLNGASGVMGPDGPNGEQWARIQEKLGEAIGKITADRLLERADEQIKLDKDRIERDLKAQVAREQQMIAMAHEYSRRVEESKFQSLAYGGRIDQLNRLTTATGMEALRPGMIIQMPDAPDLTPPARPTFNDIPGKKSANR